MRSDRREKYVSWLFPALLSLACGGMLYGADLPLVENGVSRIGAVVVAKAAPANVRHAAREMSRCLEKATGKVAPAVTEGEALPPGVAIYLGACQANAAVGLPEAGWGLHQGRIVVTEQAVHIAGKDDPGEHWRPSISLGTLFATYDFLEKQLGVRWLWPGDLGEIIPRPAGWHLVVGSRNTGSRLLSSLWRESSNKQHGWNSEESWKKFFQEQGVWLRRHRFSCDPPRFQHGHAFINYFSRFGKDHPEFFSLLPDGTRRSNPYNWSHGSPSCVSLCVSNPQLAETVVAEWQAKNPRPATINLNENDTGGECVCETCLTADHSSRSNAERLAAATELFNRKEKGWEKAMGSVSDRYCQFYLRVQALADKVDPAHRIMGLIYANYSEPPSDKIKLNDRIALRFCPPFMYPWTDAKVEQYKDIWAGWATTGAKLMFRPNFTLDGSCFPVQYQDVFYDLFNFSAEHGMVASDMDSLTGHFAAQGLVNYVIASLNHDGDSTLAQLEEDFFSAFGAAKDHIREYFDYQKQVTMKGGFKSPFTDDSIEGGILYLDLFLVADRLFTPAVMAQGSAILDRALAAPGLDEVSRQRVEFIRSGLEHMRLLMAAQAEFRLYKESRDLRQFAAAVRRLDAFRASIEHTNALNMSNLRRLEDRHWPERGQLRATADNSLPLRGWKIVWDPAEKGVAENWQAPDFALAAALDIGTDSHWEKQPAGLAWEKEHGSSFRGVAWYFNDLPDVTGPLPNPGLYFGAIDGAATIFLNGREVHHRPYPFQGNTESWKEPFSVRLPTDVLQAGRNRLAVRVEKRIGLSGIWRPAFFMFGDWR